MILRLFAIITACITLSVCSCSAAIIYNGQNPKQIALTFDDSPSFKYTEKVLDILKRENVKATFFVIGYKAELYPEIMKMIADEGHEIGNHTYLHSRITSLSYNDIIAELDMTSSVITRFTGKKVVYFRPPFGWFTRAERKMIEDHGYIFVLWSANADDYYHAGWGMRSPESIAKRVFSSLRGGDIILAHDDSEQTVKALPEIIDNLKGRGYSFVTLTELLGEGNKK